MRRLSWVVGAGLGFQTLAVADAHGRLVFDPMLSNIGGKRVRTNSITSRRIASARVGEGGRRYTLTDAVHQDNALGGLGYTAQVSLVVSSKDRRTVSLPSETISFETGFEW